VLRAVRQHQHRAVAVERRDGDAEAAREWIAREARARLLDTSSIR
jgi:hypothetical protein